MFRILALDGGGIKGIFAAAALARLEEQHKAKIIDHFDLIAGTSTGGILAIGLSLGLSPEALLNFYRSRGPTIFPSTSLVQRSAGVFSQLFVGPKHSAAVLRRELEAVLGTRKFGEAACRLVIPSYDAVANRIYIFKTRHASGLDNDIELNAVDVALATSAAPTYFAAATTARDGRYVDGGVWANNPSSIALIEAVSFLNIPLGQIDILNIGTTSEPFSIASNSRASMAKWNVGLVNLMFEAQAEACRAQVSLLLEGRLHRIDYQANDGRFSLDDAAQTSIRDLARLGAIEVEKRVNFDAISHRFLNGIKADQFRPTLRPG
jgi:patatin-like phospholipase/acyl hydrolase